MQQLESYFKALGDSNRLRIMNLLLYRELCVCDIQALLDVPQPNVSRHLAYLKHSGLVLDRREGLRIYYRLNDEKDALRPAVFNLLRASFRRDKPLVDDLRRLRHAIRSGHCTSTGWAPDRFETALANAG
jgi:ArsR family transcriptional regulator, arsenate/arsenite/antimonite-responsive transcriptional repressor